MTHKMVPVELLQEWRDHFNLLAKRFNSGELAAIVFQIEDAIAAPPADARNEALKQADRCLQAKRQGYDEGRLMGLEEAAIRGRLAQLENKLVDVEIRALKTPAKTAAQSLATDIPAAGQPFCYLWIMNDGTRHVMLCPISEDDGAYSAPITGYKSFHVLYAEAAQNTTKPEVTPEEIIEIDENGVVHVVGKTPAQLKSTVLRDPEGEHPAATQVAGPINGVPEYDTELEQHWPNAVTEPAAGTQLTAAALIIPPLNDGEHWAGIVSLGTQLHHLILLPGEFEGNWNDAIAWARKQGGDLPSPIEQKLLFVNLKDQFKPEWHWSNEPLASLPSFAWIQNFDNGNQNNDHTGNDIRARAVRRLPIQ